METPEGPSMQAGNTAGAYIRRGVDGKIFAGEDEDIFGEENELSRFGFPKPDAWAVIIQELDTAFLKGDLHFIKGAGMRLDLSVK
jgi:hypothetical protein